MEKAIEVNGLKKSYGTIKAVDGISFYVEQGKLFSFLGPNGAGKSTTIDIICTLLSYDAGEVWVDGHKLGKNDDMIRRSIGVVFQDNVLDALLTVKENLSYRSGFYIDRGKIANAVKSAAEIAGALEFIDRPYGKLSGGQRRRADMAKALVHTPKILFLDEPTTGLDPQTRKNLWNTIQKLKNDTGMTVFLTTHYMEEAADSDYVIVIDEGKIAAKGTPEELREKYAGDTLRLFAPDADAVNTITPLLSGIGAKYSAVGRRFDVSLASTMEAIPIIDVCKAHIEGFEVTSGTMDDAFIGITGKEIRE